ncbi:hypothetical protein [Lewinella cohaerens]|uniref:hypothetical protein n=1 Tax=Lewinella cohaerens TaxID=70995 RepID=UPI00039E236A|nr:hypothetical protein [Lewinella cohaerens]
MMSLIPDNWIREDFLALALHYAARADLNISADEKEFMQNRCGKAHCEKAKAFSKDKSDYEIIQVLTEMKGRFFPGEEGTSTLKGHLVGLFKVDDDYSHLEHNLMLGLDRLW